MDEPGFTLAQSQVAVVGLGLMGGSLALALRGRCRDIAGFDVDPGARALALSQSAVDRIVDLDAAFDSDLVILAAPVRAIISHLERLTALGPPRHAGPVTLIDLGSTKSDIVAAMEKLPARFDPVGGHPMCGKEVGGLASAEAGLYRSKTFVLTPLARTSPAALALAHELIAALGALPLVLSPARHDALTAVTSHLPYVVAVALVRAAQSLDDEQVWDLAASGFRDTSRLAASELAMMVDILLTNRLAVLEALVHYRAELDGLVEAIEAGDAGALRAGLASARERRAGLFQ